MAFLRSRDAADAAALVRGRGVVLRAPELADFDAWAQLRGQSRAHLTPFEPRWAGDELSYASFRRRLGQYARDAADDVSYAYFILSASDDVLLGGLSLSNIRRGVSQAATLGYWIGQPYAGRGFMTDAVRTASVHAFETLRLHRIEAATLPDNATSLRVLEKCGFAREGLARRYLKIDGVWRDHVLFALLDDDSYLREARA